MDTSFARAQRRDLIVAAVIAAVAALLPLFVTDVYAQNIMVLTLMFAALSQSWNILSGYCGQISLGHALYFGLGAYASTILFTKFGVLPWIGMVGGGVDLRFHRPGARLSVLSPARALFHHRHGRDRRDRLPPVPQLGLGRRRPRHPDPRSPRQLAPVPVPPRQDPVFLFRAGSCVRDLVRDLVASRIPNGATGGAR